MKGNAVEGDVGGNNRNSAVAQAMCQRYESNNSGSSDNSGYFLTTP